MSGPPILPEKNTEHNKPQKQQQKKTPKQTKIIKKPQPTNTTKPQTNN